MNQPGRTPRSTLGAPSDPLSVEPSYVTNNKLASCHRSRPGPDNGGLEGVFQPALPGKYARVSSRSVSEDFPNFSLTPDTIHDDGQIPSTSRHQRVSSTALRPNHSGSATGASSVHCTNLPTSDLHVYYQNVGGMNSTVNDYLLASTDNCYDIIALTETWLDDRTLSTQVFDTSYDVFRCDRCPSNSQKISGGGVLLAVSHRLKARLVPNIDWISVEQVWVEIKLSDRSLFLCVVYLPPDRVRDESLLSVHIDSIMTMCSKLNSVDDILIVGDFNLPGIKWKRTRFGFLYPDVVHSTIPSSTVTLLDSYSTCLLQQINHVENNNGRILDLCFVSNADSAPVISEAAAPLVKLVPHHPPLHLILEHRTMKSFRQTVAEVYYDFKSADYEMISDVLSSIDWVDALSATDVDAAVQTFSNIVSYVIDRHVPKRVNSKHCPWQTNELRQMKTAKKAALRRFSKHRTVTLRDYYVRLNHQYQRASQSCYRTYITNIQLKLKANPKSFWKFVTDQRKESGLPTTMVYEGRWTSDLKMISDLFAEKFRSVFSEELLLPQQIDAAAEDVPFLGHMLTNIEIDENMIVSAARELKSSCSVGPDGIPSILLKKCTASLLLPLHRIFSLSLASGKFPTSWNTAYLFPVHKKGDKTNIDNYRGISALNSVAKLLELVVLPPIFSFCRQYIVEEQHGFMPKRSTATNLLSFTSYISDGFNNAKQTDAIYLDLTAAFDSINHEIALAKLANLGFGGRIINWLRSYLIGRQLAVKIGDQLSFEFGAPSGIPQGSHLGPLIFLLYFNDVNMKLKVPRLSFADDMKLFLQIKSIADACMLQQQLNNFSQWCDVNRMRVNPSKCEVITFSMKKEPILYDYKLLDTSIKRTSCVKDLGVQLDSKLSFQQHITYIVGKASRSLGFLFRIGKDFTDVYCLKSLYGSLVRSTLEYCSQVWSPYYQNGVERIESVQRRFVRFALRRLPWMDRFRLPSYESRCQLMNLDTLVVRRNLARVMFVSDVMTARTECKALLDRIQLQAQPRTLRNSTFLQIPARRTNYGTYGMIVGLLRMFNRVAEGFDFNLSRESIKRNFKRILTSLNIIRA